MTNAYDIINTDANINVLGTFFAGMASGDYYDGLCYRLYLDTTDGSITEHVEASENSWLQRDDGSLVEIAKACGYTDTPDSDRYADGDDLADYGYGDWLDMIEAKVAEAIA